MNSAKNEKKFKRSSGKVRREREREKSLSGILQRGGGLVLDGSTLNNHFLIVVHFEDQEEEEEEKSEQQKEESCKANQRAQKEDHVQTDRQADRYGAEASQAELAGPSCEKNKKGFVCEIRVARVNGRAKKRRKKRKIEEINKKSNKKETGSGRISFDVVFVTQSSKQTIKERRKSERRKKLDCSKS